MQQQPAAPPPATPQPDRADETPRGGDAAATAEVARPAEAPVEIPEELPPATEAAVPVTPPIDVPETPPAQRIAKSVAAWGPSVPSAGAKPQGAPAPAPRTIKDWRAETPASPATPESGPQSIRTWRYVESPPRRIFAVAPAYPTLAKRQNLAGRVTLAVVVLPDGTVAEEPRIVSALPAGRGFERAAADAVRQWRFEPATRDGKPVAANLTVAVDFK